MYSPKVVAKNIEKFASQEGWTPVAHSIEEVDEFNGYIDSITKKESNSKNTYIELSKPLSKKRADEVRRWIINEQVMCSLDSNYWETRYAYIADEMGTVSKFKNRKSQEVIDSILSDLDEKEVSKELLILGSRQSGASTKIILKIMHRVLFQPYVQSLVASPVYECSDIFSRITNNIYQKCPWWLVPIKMPKNSLANGSLIATEFGSSRRGMAQGFTPQCVYITNVEEFPDPVKTFEEGMLRSSFSSKNTLLVLHGMKTKEPNSWINCLWNESKANYDKGLARFMPVFIPWPICSDIYPDPHWIKKYPVPESWKPMKETVEHVRRCESYIRKTPYLSKVVGPKWKMPVEQKWYWEFFYKHALAMHTVDSFLSQLPADDDSAVKVSEAHRNEVVDEETDLDNIFPSASQIQETLENIRRSC